MLTAAQLREHVSYDPETGIFKFNAIPVREPKDHARNQRVTGMVAGHLNHHGYVEIRIMWRRYGAHRLAWLYMTGGWPEGQIDHIDRCRSNNVWENLRDVTATENQRNRTQISNTASGVCGVTRWAKNDKWRAYIAIGGRQIHLGTFETKADAMAARLAAVEAHYLIRGVTR